jgi:hypothetical protein
MKKQTEKTVLVLRTCRADMTSCHGYKWPVKGKVSAPDWRDDFDCGGGLHGWLWGEGDGSLGIWDVGAKWLVVRVLESDIRHGKGELIGKCKFPKGVVVFCGDRKEATDFIAANGAAGKSIVGGTATAGYRGTATAGYRGTATAGYSGLICIKYWDAEKERYRIAVGYVGEDGIKPGVKYRLDDNNKFVEAI